MKLLQHSKFYFLLLFLILYSNLFSQNQKTALNSEKNLIEYSINNWDKENGLPTIELIDICQTDEGYIWLSSYNGLMRFDGKKFKTYNSKNIDFLNGNSLGAIAEDNTGTLWITSQSSGLISYKDGVFYNHFTSDSIKYLYSVIYVDSNDNIWSSTTEGGWFMYNKEDYKFLNYKIPLENIELKTICEDNTGTMWFGTAGNGIFKYSENQLINYTIKDGLNSNWVRTIYVDREDNLWIGTDKGVNIFNGKEFLDLEKLRGNTVNKIISNDEGKLWMSTSQGLICYDIETHEIESLSTSNGLRHNDINNLMIDHENSLWIINYKAGLTRIKENKFVTYSIENGMSGKIVNAVCETSPGIFLVGFNNGKINQIKNNNISEFKTKKSLHGKRIRHIMQDSKNNIWISTYSGLLMIAPNGKEEWYSENTGFPGKYIRLTYEDKNGNIWVASRNNGLIKINKEKSPEVFEKTEGLSSNMIMSIEEDPNGLLYIGTSKGGLIILDSEKVIKNITKNEGLAGEIVFNTFFDSKGNIWITTNEGLNCIFGNKVYKIETHKTYINFTPYDILEDNKGNLWMSTDKGVISVKRDCLIKKAKNITDSCDFILYDKNDGILQAECTSTSNALKSTDGTLWFPTVNGITCVNPNKLLKNNHIPGVYIEDFIVENESINLKDKIEINYGKNRISINFTALSFFEPDDVYFKYKLEGYENEWSEAVKYRSISFTNLLPGEYVFKVIACNNDGLWNTEGDSIRFSVLPKFHQTTFFYIILTIILIISLYFIYIFRVKGLKKKQKELELLINERTSEIRNMNHEISRKNKELIGYQNHLEEKISERTKDLEIAKLIAEKADQLKTSFLENLSHEIRTPLNIIVGYSSLIESDSSLSEKSKKCVSNIISGGNSLAKIVDSVLDVTRLHHDDIKLFETEFNLYEFLDKIHSEFINSAIFKKKLDTELNKVCNINKDLIVKCDKEKLHTILFNLIENALKFTDSGYVEYGVNIGENNKLLFYVKDTGIGMEAENIKYIFDKFRKIETNNNVLYRGLGLGLSITQGLVKLLKGDISVESEAGKGTQFNFFIPVSIISKQKTERQ